MRPPVILFIVGTALLFTGGVAVATFIGSESADEFGATSETVNTSEANDEPTKDDTEEDTEEDIDSEAEEGKDKKVKKADKKTGAEKGNKRSGGSAKKLLQRFVG
jgi:hypothetical protein